MASAKFEDVLLMDENPKPSHSKCYDCWSKGIASILILILVGSTITFGVLWGLKVKLFSSSKYSVEKGIIGFPITLPNDGNYVQWTFLHLNDVYEMLPMFNGQKGGLARVAHIRKLLLEENRNTYTFLAGDLVSPSALSQAIVNNGTLLNGQHMIASLNALGLDFMTFGNHEFDYSNESIIIQRMDESKFIWISTNVLDKTTNESYHTSIPYKVLEINSVRVLIFGLTIELEVAYVNTVDKKNTVALTHLSMPTDVELLENIPEIDLIIGGHEHVNYHYHRGEKYSPVYKADANAFSVYIHRCALNLDTRRFRIYSTIAFVTPEVPEDESTRQVVNYWYELALEGFETMGYEINRTISCLPDSVVLDGRFSSVRNFPTLLSNFTCECMLYATADNKTIVGLFDSGSIRIDDVLEGKITEYDAIRVLPYQNPLYSLSVPGALLSQVLIDGMSQKGRGMFLSYCGVETKDGKTWFVNGQDISTTGLNYNVATISYAYGHTKLNDSSVTVLNVYDITQTKSLIDYLPTKYPPC